MDSLKKKKKSEWITEASACLAGIRLKREDENMWQNPLRSAMKLFEINFQVLHTLKKKKVY